MPRLETISVAIPCHNNSNNLLGILASLHMQTRIPDEIVIVDDNSSEKEKDEIRKISYLTRSKYLQLPEPNNKTEFQGRRSMARNMATRCSKSDIILYLDGDMLLAPRYIEEIIRYHQKDNYIFVKGQRCNITQEEQSKGLNYCLAVAASGSVCETSKQSIYGQRFSDVETYLQPFYATAIIGAFANNKRLVSRRFFLTACLTVGSSAIFSNSILFDTRLPYSLDWQACISNNLSVRRKHVAAIGYWDETFIGWGEEDIDFAYRLAKHGLRPVTPIFTEIKAYHLDHYIDMQANKVSLEKNAKYITAKHPLLLPLRRPVYLSHGIDIETSSFQVDKIRR